MRLEDPNRFTVRRWDPTVSGVGWQCTGVPPSSRPGWRATLGKTSSTQETLSETMNERSFFELPFLSLRRGWNNARLAGLPGWDGGSEG